MAVLPPPEPDEGETTTTTVRLGEKLLADIRQIATARREKLNKTMVRLLRLGRDTYRKDEAAGTETTEPVKPKK